MSSVLVIARDTLRGFIHQKLLLALVVATLGVTFGFAQLSSWQRNLVEAGADRAREERSASATPVDAKTERATEQALEQMFTFQQAAFFGLASLGGSLVALLLFSTVVASPLKRGEVRGVLSRPLTRSRYVLGRYLAALGALAGYWIIMSLAFFVFFRLAGAGLPASVRYAAPLLFCKGAMLGSIALALSLVVRPAVAVTIAIVVSSDWVSSKGWLYLILPGDDRLSAATQILQGSVLAPSDVALAALYATDVAAIALGLALIRFRRVDIA